MERQHGHRAAARQRQVLLLLRGGRGGGGVDDVGRHGAHARHAGEPRDLESGRGGEQLLVLLLLQLQLGAVGGLQISAFSDDKLDKSVVAMPFKRLQSTGTDGF